MAGEEQAGCLASVETPVSTKDMLLQPLNPGIGRPGENPERHQRHEFGERVLQIVLLAASMRVL